MGKRRMSKVISGFILILTFLLIDYFTFNIPPPLENADILIVEGWIPEDQLQTIPPATLKAYKTIVTTGVALPPYFIMPQRGSLIFKDVPGPSRDALSGKDGILVYASGTLSKKQGAGFILYSDTALLDTFLTGRKREAFLVSKKSTERESDSLIIRYFNDGIYRGKDKNLHIYGIEINDTFLSPYSDKVFYDRFDHDGKFRSSNGVFSYADLAATALRQQGIRSEKIIRLEAPGKSRLRTLDSAWGFRDWAQDNDIQGLKVNILTTREHSRKTYHTYRKLLGDSDTETGLLVISPKETKRPVQFRTKLVEYGAYWYYRLFVLPFH